MSKYVRNYVRVLKHSIMYFELDEDDMVSSKRRSIFMSLTFKLTAQREETDLIGRT